MKITKTSKPLVLKIEFSSQQELDLFGSLINCSPVCDAWEEVARDLGLASDLAFAHEDMDACGAKIHDHPNKLAKALIQAPYVANIIRYRAKHLTTSDSAKE